MANIGQELLNVPFPQMVEALGMSIARAQTALDMNSIKIAQIMSGSPYIDQDGDGNDVMREGVKVSFGGKLLSLLELGFTPTFYQFVDTVIEVKLSMSMMTETEERRSSMSMKTDMNAKVSWWSSSASASISVSTVSASFAARNSFKAEGASLIRTKLVPLPPPAVLQDRIRALLEDEKKKELDMDPVVFELVHKSGGAGSQVVQIGTQNVTLSDTVGMSTPGVVTAAVDKRAQKVTVTSVKAGVVTLTVTGTTGTGAEQRKLKGEIKVLVRAES
jgi:hypothetical protein